MTIDLEVLLKSCMKPEEIQGSGEVKLKRIQELLGWFVRLESGQANPKWLRGHAYELAYHIATTTPFLDIDISTIEMRGFREGCAVPEDSIIKTKRLYEK